MTATTPHAMLVDEVRAQINANISGWDASYTLAEEWPAGGRNRWPHDLCIVRTGAASWREADNEADFVTYRIEVLICTLTDDREEALEFLDKQCRAIKLMLADRASDQSPLRTNPLPTTSHNLASVNAAVHRIAVGSTVPATVPQDQGMRHAVMLPLDVTTYETATG